MRISHALILAARYADGSQRQRQDDAAGTRSTPGACRSRILGLLTYHYYFAPAFSKSPAVLPLPQDILSGRKNMGTTEGTISFSGSAPSRAFLRKFTGCDAARCPVARMRSTYIVHFSSDGRVFC